ncbi:cysteine hydrolase [Hydrogenophaga sp. PAMC20947]|uniref:cysteine hydrolase n=1 Tax=Hydrogenophaga sp. PAMC20947 TaxID=2565558 RepID=UPI00109DC54B|nr:cysteine hydrolase [Hydrogenophaga sp. PAMC20947]QCB44651.1 cysteine hydrolase [Hydrogenophaga sp. PAMC20947]
MKQNIQLLIIDPQNDFCDVPEPWQGVDPLSGQRIAPALPVQGAHADMLRLAELIQAGQAGLSDMVVTLDSHHLFDVAHPAYWQQADGSPVAPFTPIAAQQVRGGLFRTRDPGAQTRTLQYLDALEAQGRYGLMVWPLHCEIGTWGHNVHAAVRQAYNQWEVALLRTVQVVYKGSNPWTEHYSALQAEVPDATDPDTQLNRALIAELDRADVLLVAGEASSHCVKATMEHLVDNLPSGAPNKIILITDCMSPVGGFEAEGKAFVAGMLARGVRQATAAEVLPLLQANRP